MPRGGRVLIPDEKRCTAKAKRTGERCGMARVHGSTKCRVHGGMSPVGSAAGNFKNGRYSKWLPARLKERYEQALTDPNLLSLQDELGLVDARIADLMGRVDAGQAHDQIEKLVAGVREVASAMRGRDWGKAMQVMLRLEQEVLQPQQDYAAWSEMWALVDRRQRLVESERRRMVDLKQYLTAGDATGLILAVAGIVQRHVQDPTALRLIAGELKTLLERPGHEALPER